MGLVFMYSQGTDNNVIWVMETLLKPYALKIYATIQDEINLIPFAETTNKGIIFRH